MPILSRRQTQAILNDIGPKIPLNALKLLKTRLNSAKTDEVIPAEYEIITFWGLAQLGDIEYEPYWWGINEKPDFFTECLIPGVPVALEVTAMKDNSLSGLEDMTAIAQQFEEGGADVIPMGQNVHYTFGEAFRYSPTYSRYRLAPKGFVVPLKAKADFRRWLEAALDKRSVFEYRDLNTHVVARLIEGRAELQHRIFCSMPVECYSLRDNPIYKRLVRKLKQLQSDQREVLRGILLFSNGSTLIEDCGTDRERDWSGRRVSGSDIFRQFLKDYDQQVDFLITASPVVDYFFHFECQVSWKLIPFAKNCIRDQINAAASALEALLPRPLTSARYAGSMQEKGCFGHNTFNLWLRTQFSLSRRSGKVRISQRLILDFLAGRISENDLRKELGDGSQAYFEMILKSGKTISDVRIEKCNATYDDDYLVFEYSDDAAARPYDLPDKRAKE